ncbi:MAG: DUF5801 repeats-in-toxin domain-containing protein, partial [Candidatus Berkiella sp.]
MVTKSADEGIKQGKGTDTERALNEKDAVAGTTMQKVPGADIPLDVDSSLRDVFIDFHPDTTPTQEISDSFEQAFLSYSQMSEKEFLEEVKEALVKTADKGPDFLNLEFEQLFDVPLQEGGSEAGRAISGGSEGGVTSLERFLSFGVSFSQSDDDESFRVQSQPQTLAFNTGATYAYAVAPTQSPNLGENGPKAPPVFLPPLPKEGEQITINETALNTQDNVIIQGNIFVPSAFNNFQPASSGAGLYSMDVFFNFPARAGSTEVHGIGMTILTTPEGNVFTFDRATGDYTYELNNPVLHLLSVWGSDYVDPTEEIFTDRFVYAITDVNFLTAVGPISVFIGDDHPVATDQVQVAITEADIQTIGTNQSPTPEQLPGSLISFPTNIFGADGGTVTNVVLTSAKTNGVTNATGNTSIAAGTITVTDSEGNVLEINQATGATTFHLNNSYSNINHQPTILVYTFTFTDADLDTVTKTVTLTINDDAPIGTIVLKPGIDVATDETPGIQGPDDALPASSLGQNTVSYASLITDTTLNGSDIPGTKVFNLSAIEGAASGYTTPDGSQNIVLHNNAGVIEGHVGTTVGALVFTVSVNSSTGDVTLTQYLAVQHPTTDPNELSSSMTAGVLTFTVTLTDQDGDSIAPSVDLGSVIKFYDDGPSGTIALKAGIDIATDETPGPGLQGPETADVGLGQTTVAYADLIDDFTIYGSDGAGTKVFSLVATDGTDSGFMTPDGSTIIRLFNVGGDIEGHAGTLATDPLVFRVHVDSSTGDVTLTQYLAVQHATNDPNELSGGMNANALLLKATVTDADSDFIAPTVDLGSVVKFYDDGPSGTIALNANVDVATDETPGVQSPDDAAPMGTLGQTTVSYATLINDSTIYGSDGAGSKVFSLDIVGGDGTASGYKISDGSEDVLLSNNGGVIEGRSSVGDDLVFTIAVNVNGDVTLTQYLAVQHTPDSGDNQLSAGMTAGVLNYVVTVTDADSDFIAPTVDLGSVVKFYDDAPSGTIALADDALVATDETPGPGLQGPETADVGLGQTTVAYADLIDDSTIYGSDGAGSKVFSLDIVGGDGTASGYKISDGSEDVLLSNNGGVIEGRSSVGDELVFTIAVNVNGDVTLTQYLAVQHTPDSGDNQLSAGMTVGVLNYVVTVTDADSDFIAPTVDLGSVVKFYDDAPSGTIALADDALVATDETPGPGLQGPETADVGLGQTTVAYADLIDDFTIYGSDGAG